MALLHSLRTPEEMARTVGANAKAIRLERNFSRETLASRSGVSAQTIARLENEGQVTLSNLILVAVALGCTEGFDQLFTKKAPATLEELKKPVRKRGRQ